MIKIRTLIKDADKVMLKKYRELRNLRNELSTNQHLKIKTTRSFYFVYASRLVKVSDDFKFKDVLKILEENDIHYKSLIDVGFYFAVYEDSRIFKDLVFNLKDLENADLKEIYELSDYLFDNRNYIKLSIAFSFNVSYDDYKLINIARKLVDENEHIGEYIKNIELERLYEIQRHINLAYVWDIELSLVELF